MLSVTITESVIMSVIGSACIIAAIALVTGFYRGRLGACDMIKVNIYTGAEMMILTAIDVVTAISLIHPSASALIRGISFDDIKIYLLILLIMTFVTKCLYIYNALRNTPIKVKE